MAENPNIRVTYEKVLHETNGRANEKFVIRIIQWNGRGAGLEKRMMFRGDDGEWRPGKAKAFQKQDFDLLLARAAEIQGEFEKLNRRQSSATIGDAVQEQLKNFRAPAA